MINDPTISMPQPAAPGDRDPVGGAARPGPDRSSVSVLESTVSGPESGGVDLEPLATTVGYADGAPPMVNRRFGRYVLIEQLGFGKQAVVWKAVQLGPGPRVVAVKVYSTGWRPERLERVARLRLDAARGGPLAGTTVLPLDDFG